MHATFGIVEQLPVLPPDRLDSVPPWHRVSLAEWMRTYLAELVFTSWDLQGYAQELGWVGPPFVWDAARRAYARAELDAAFFHAYGLAQEEVKYVLDSFWGVRRNDESASGAYRTKDMILAAFDAMSEASHEAPFRSRLDPPPGDPAVAHEPREGDGPGSWDAYAR